MQRHTNSRSYRLGHRHDEETAAQKIIGSLTIVAGVLVVVLLWWLYS